MQNSWVVEQLNSSSVPTLENNCSKSAAAFESDFGHLDADSFRAIYTNAKNPQSMSFYVEGISCSRCLWRIEKLPETQSGLLSARVNMSQSTVQIDLDSNGSFAAVAQRLNEMGYTPHPIQPDSQTEQSLQTKENHQHLKRLGVAAACAGNIMLLSVSIYAGASGALARGFEWLSFALFLPVAFYSSQPFYRSFWAAIRNRRASIDIPIVAALVIGGGLSFWHLLNGHGDIYFDSLAVLVFLLLSSRYLLRRIQQNYLSPSYLLPFFASDKIRVWNNENKLFELTPVQQLKAGSRIKIVKGEKLPADGRALSSIALVNSAILTGESLPVKVHSGGACFAGTELVSDELEFVAEKVGANSRVGQLLQQMEKEVMAKTPLISLTDTIGQWFTVAVLSLGFLFFATYAFVDLTEAIRRSLALVILACPCALAFATPLTQSLSLAKAIRDGYLIKKAEVLEKLYNIKQVIFDKTGTLTEGDFRLVHWYPKPPNEKVMAAILALEMQSEHPVAKAFVAYLQGQVAPATGLENYQEVLGQGVEGQVQGHRYEVKRTDDVHPDKADQAAIHTSVGVFLNDELLATAVFGDRLRQDAKAAMSKLRSLGISAFLLSGDSPRPVKQIADQLGIPESKCFSRFSPEDKLQFVKRHPQAMMVGDGANDSVALAASHVSMAVHGSMESSLQAADIYLTQPGVQPVADVVLLARKSMHVIKRNLVFSLIYNLAGGAAALMGWIDPLAAAILMPLSSGVVFASSLLGTRGDPK